MDLRGHGQSDRPPDGYDDQDDWAEDVHAVITTLGLERPILCGWSYGGVVIGDYIRRHGELAVGGICLVGAVSQLGESVMPFLGEKFIATLPGLFSDEVSASTTALEEFIGITTSSAPTADDLYLTLGYSSVVPPFVRRALLSRTLNHEDVFERLAVPVLIAHGLDDEIVLPTMSERHASNSELLTFSSKL